MACPVWPQLQSVKIVSEHVQWSVLKFNIVVENHVLLRIVTANVCSVDYYSLLLPILKQYFFKLFFHSEVNTIIVWVLFYACRAAHILRVTSPVTRNRTVSISSIHRRTDVNSSTSLGWSRNPGISRCKGHATTNSPEHGTVCVKGTLRGLRSFDVMHYLSTSLFFWICLTIWLNITYFGKVLGDRNQRVFMSECGCGESPPPAIGRGVW